MRLLGRGGDGGDGGGAGRRGLGLRPQKVVVEAASFEFVDASAGVSARGEAISFEAVLGEPLTVRVGRIDAETHFGPRAGLVSAVVEVDPDDPRGTATATIEGGFMSPWKGLFSVLLLSVCPLSSLFAKPVVF